MTAAAAFYRCIRCHHAVPLDDVVIQNQRGHPELVLCLRCYRAMCAGRWPK